MAAYRIDSNQDSGFAGVRDVGRAYVAAHEAIERGHYIQEEVPDEVIRHFTGFFKA
jgi:hypothetical protein